ncbi:MAG TPA: aldehyde dehydrogenase family protein [Nevskiaceae bacterium]
MAVTADHVAKRPELAAIREHMIIDGKPVKKGEGTVPVYDPATGKVIAQQVEAGAKQVDAAVRAARKALESPEWRNFLPSGRERLLLKLADKIEEEGDTLARLETLNNGKTLALSKMIEVDAGAQWLRYMAGWATKIRGDTLDISFPFPPGVKYHVYTRREPVGVVGAIVPWNFPMLMGIWKMAPAIAAGCTVVLKPAEETPLTAIRLAELALEVGFPPGVFNVITGRGEITGAALVAHPGVNKIAFTGSTEVGKILRRASADDMKRLSLELGGKSPMVIMDDCPIELAVQGAIMGGFFNQGEVCTCGSRLLIQDGIYDKVTQGLAQAVNGMKVGSGFDADTQIGPLVSKRQLDRVVGYIDAGRADGARVLAGGSAIDGDGYFVRPTVFADAPETASIVREEIFGPVVVASRFKTEEEAIRKANDTPYGLGASVWSNDEGRIQRLSRGIQAGTVWVNCHNVVDPNMPFGGYKQSGFGREHGRNVMDLYLETKSVCVAYGGTAG